jgi:RHS repeat-associated protein
VYVYTRVKPLARMESNGRVRYYQSDALGSVIALTDETGASRTQYIYDSFGNVTMTGEASNNPFQYTGRENDGTGLYYYRARYCSPELQRFISEDPIRLAGGINFYSYIKNNPIISNDPKGLSEKFFQFKGPCQDKTGILKGICKLLQKGVCKLTKITDICCKVDFCDCIDEVDERDPRYDAHWEECWLKYSPRCQLGAAGDFIK